MIWSNLVTYDESTRSLERLTDGEAGNGREELLVMVWRRNAPTITR